MVVPVVVLLGGLVHHSGLCGLELQTSRMGAQQLPLKPPNVELVRRERRPRTGRGGALRYLGQPVGVGAEVVTRAWHPSRLIRVSALGESCPTAAAASLKSAHPNFPRAPFAQRDAGRERGTDRECTQHRCEPDGVLVVENRVNTVQEC